MKMDGPVFDKKLYSKLLGLPFSSKLEWVSYIVSIAKTAFKKVGALISPMTFLSPEAALFPINLPYCLAWNIVASSGLGLLVVTGMFWIRYSKWYVKKLFLL